MKFESSFTTQEKKLVYQRTLKDLERQLMERLLQEGITRLMKRLLLQELKTEE
jgi:hypothetical protein